MILKKESCDLSLWTRLVWSCCQTSPHMVLDFIDHEVIFHPAPPDCLCMWLETLQMVTSSRWRGAWALKSVLLIDPVHILKIKEGIKGIAKLLKTLHAPKKGTIDSVNKQSRWWLLVGAITPSTPITARQTAEGFYFNVGQQYGSHFDWHLSLIRGRKSSLGKSSVQIN